MVRGCFRCRIRARQGSRLHLLMTPEWWLMLYFTEARSITARLLRLLEILCLKRTGLGFGQKVFVAVAEFGV